LLLLQYAMPLWHYSYSIDTTMAAKSRVPAISMMEL